MTYTFQGREVTKEVINQAMSMINEYQYQIELELDVPHHIVELSNDLSNALQ